MTHYNADRDNAKLLILQLLYGGTLNSWKKWNNITSATTTVTNLDTIFNNTTNNTNNNNITNNNTAESNTLNDPVFIKEFVAEFNNIQKVILKDNADFAELLKNHKIAIKSNIYNIKSSVISWLLMDYERRILEIIVKYINNNKLVLCYDGLLIPK